MEENIHLWNKKDLQPPPVSTYEIKSPIDINGLLLAFKNAVYFVNLKYLRIEGAVLSRTVYRMKMKYRTDKGFKCLLKLHHCLLQYFHMDFGRTINVFYELIPKNKMGAYMPSGNMLDYILVRLQGLTMLLSRIIETSQLSACFMEHKIPSGDYWRMALIILGITSRIWIVTKKMIRFCYKFYLNILHFRSKLEIVGPKWLPNNYQFPDNLETWLIEHQAFEINKYERSIILNTKIKFVERFSELNTLTNVSSESKEDIQSEDEIHVSSSDEGNNFYSMMQNNDIGEVVSRLEETENNTSNKVTKALRNDENILENSSQKVVKVNEIKTDQLEERNKMIADVHKPVKTNILLDYFGKKRAQTSKLRKFVEGNKNSCNSVTQENNYKLMKTETTLSKQFTSNNNTPEKAQILFGENNIPNITQKALVQASKSQLKSNTHDVEDIDDILESMKSINDVKSFLKRQATSRENKKCCVSSKLDRLQWHMLEKEIKKCIKKANKTTVNSKNYLLKAKDLLKVSLT